MAQIFRLHFLMALLSVAGCATILDIPDGSLKQENTGGSDGGSSGTGASSFAGTSGTAGTGAVAGTSGTAGTGGVAGTSGTAGVGGDTGGSGGGPGCAATGSEEPCCDPTSNYAWSCGQFAPMYIVADSFFEIVYWANLESGTIMRMGASGKEPEVFESGILGLDKIALSSSTVWWNSADSSSIALFSKTTGGDEAVLRASNVINLAAGLYGAVYWDKASNSLRYLLEASQTPTTIANDQLYSQLLSSLVVSGDTAYWNGFVGEPNGRVINRASLSGGPGNSTTVDANKCRFIVTDEYSASYVFCDNAVLKVPNNGEKETTLYSPTQLVWGLPAAAADYVYWMAGAVVPEGETPSTMVLRRVSISTGEDSTLTADLPFDEFYTIAVTDHWVYWTSPAQGTVNRVKKNMN